MTALVLIIIAIALLSVLLIADINYTPVGLFPKKEMATLTQTGFTSLGSAFLAYRTSKGAAPSVANWATELTPSFGFLPKPPPGGTWSYGTDGSGYWFCMTAAVNEYQHQGLLDLRKNLSNQAYFMNSSCGAKANASPPGAFPVTVSATYWVTPY